MSVRATIRYSEAFKLQVLRELEEGKFPSMTAAARAYGISGLGMVKYWAEKYGRSQVVGKVVRVETAKEVSEVKELRKRVRDLEKALANERLDHLLDEAYLQIACRTAGVTDVEEFKKKHAGKV